MSASLSDVDKAAIIESVLDLELHTQQTFPDVTNIRNVSSENIQFMSASQLLKHGFTLVAANQLCEWQAKRVERFLVFKKLFLRDGIVVIGLSRVTGGRSCFGGRFYSELGYTYEARQTSDGWITELTRRPMPNFFAGRKRLNTARCTREAKPNKSLDASGGSEFRIMTGPAKPLNSRRPVNSDVGPHLNVWMNPKRSLL